MDELSARRAARRRIAPSYSFEKLLDRGVRWPFQTALEFPDNPPAMPQMRSSRRPRGDLVFESSKMRRPVRCESRPEQVFFSELDRLPEILWFHEQAPKVKYLMNGRLRDYYPDALVALRNGHVFVVEVKTCWDFALFTTIRKANALIERAHALGQGVFLGNHSYTVGDFVDHDVPQGLRAAVVTECKSSAGMSADKWRNIRRWSRKRYGVPSSSLQALVLTERLVMTTNPFNVRPASPAEAKEIDVFVDHFRVDPPGLPLAAAMRKARPQATGEASAG